LSTTQFRRWKEEEEEKFAQFAVESGKKKRTTNAHVGKQN
jgi:hypothetical protein